MQGEIQCECSQLLSTQILTRLRRNKFLQARRWRVRVASDSQKHALEGRSDRVASSQGLKPAPPTSLGFTMACPKGLHRMELCLTRTQVSFRQLHCGAKYNLVSLLSLCQCTAGYFPESRPAAQNVSKIGSRNPLCASLYQ